MLATALLLGGFLVEPGPGGALKPSKAERLEFREHVTRLLDQDDYAGLESLATELREKDPRFSSGISKLVNFHDALILRVSGDPALVAAAAEKRFTKWLQHSPKSYLPKVALFALASQRAARVRGTGFADTVTPDRWKSHREHLEVAQSWATKALADDPRDPEFFAQLIMLCRSQGCPRQTAEAWLARALAINPGYDGVYVDMANYLLPRWLGSPEEFVAFAARAADENKTLGNIAYARIATVALLVDGRKGGLAFREMYPGLSWQRIRDGLSEIDRRFPGSARTYHLLARFAHVYEDKERGRAALTRLGTTWDLDGEDYWPTEKAFRESREWAFGADR